jgi:anti-anti-sigma factor
LVRVILGSVLDVVVDFADVDIVTSSSVAKLLKLRKVLYDNNRKLVFSSVRPKTKSIFNITGLDTVFEFVDDQFIALASLQLVN